MLHALIDLLPDINTTIGSKRNFATFRDLLLADTPTPRVLVLGGSIEGQGMAALTGASLDLVASDVSFGPLTALICDAHDIPFEDGTFDGVIAQAVLEHVVDPSRCVDEIHRVSGGCARICGDAVYAASPYGAVRFTRFTRSGHRRLFRRFDEIAAGAVLGPGMALASSYSIFS